MPIATEFEPNSIIERSDEMQQVVNTARQDIKNTETPQEKSEIAKETRMRFQLANAEVAVELMSALEKNPDMGRAEMLDLVVQTNKVTDDHTVQRGFVQQVYHTVHQVQNQVKRFEMRGFSKEDIAEILYNQLKKGNDPTDKSKLKFSVTPLALKLVIESEEMFNAIDRGTNIGGSFTKALIETPVKHKVLKWLKFSTEEVNEVPLILVKGAGPHSAQRTEEMERHETLHSQHAPARAITSIRPTQKGGSRIRAFWAKFDTWEKPAKDIEILKNVREKPELIARSKSKVVDFAYSRAKSEILAEYFENPTEPMNIEWLTQKLSFENYNYLSQMGLDKQSPNYTDLLEIYKTKLEQNTRPTINLLNTLGNLGLTKRLKLMHWVLAQIPLDEWEQQLEATGYFEETQQILATKDLLVDYQEACQIVFKGEDTQAPLQDLNTRQTEYESTLQDNQHQPLKKQAFKAQKEVRAIGEQIPSLETRLLYLETKEMLFEFETENASVTSLIVALTQAKNESDPLKRAQTILKLSNSTKQLRF